ncbi:hypothetical protein SUGI_0669700 [Cryptomeria japonica]|nr:hypothetical protein SUGI_0669700 [Cryptomeria japonica]
MALINELPQKIFRKIIIRLPYTFHNTLKRVCKKWKDMVESVSFYQDRIEYAKSEKFICLLHQAGISMYDPVHGSWHGLPPLLPGFKPSHSSRLVWWATKLVVMGLERNHTDKSVLVYDFCSPGWREGQEEPEGRREDWQFGYSASAQGIVYVPPSKAYMIAQDNWEADHVMPEQLPSGVSIAGIAYLFDPITGNGVPKVFDPKVRNWLTTENLGMEEVPMSELVMKGVSGKIWGANFYKNICDIMSWDGIFWYEGPPVTKSGCRQRFYMFEPHKPDFERWIDIQMPIESEENLRVYSATTIEI